MPDDQLFDRSADLTTRYHRDGFAQLPTLFGAERLAETHRSIDPAAAVATGRMDPSDYTLERNGTVRNLWRLEHYNEFFADLGHDAVVLEPISQLLGESPELVAVETFNKPALHGSAVPPHQDNAYFCLEPPNALTLWLALDPVTEYNGPVHYARDTAATLLPHRASGIPGNSMLLTDPPTYDSSRVEVGILNRGDAMAHHCQTVHWSGPNRSASNRRGLLMVYRGCSSVRSPALEDRYRAAQAEFDPSAE